MQTTKIPVKSQKSSWKFGKSYWLSIVFPPGADIVSVKIPENDRIRNIRQIHIREYSVTLEPVGAEYLLPAKVDLCCSQPFFRMNLNYDVNSASQDSIPLVLHNPSITPGENYRFSECYAIQPLVCDPPNSTSCQFPVSFGELQFWLTSLSANSSTPINVPGNIVLSNRVKLAEESCIILQIDTWESTVEDWTNPLQNIPRSYY